MSRCVACNEELRDELTETACPRCGTPLPPTSAATVTVTVPIRGSVDDAVADGAPLVVGQVFASRYAIVSFRGSGGMGSVYRADDLRLNQTVALKILHPTLSGPARSARIAREVRLAREVSHPNVCRVYDIGHHDDVDYLSMEFVDGPTLADLLRRPGGVPAARAQDIARQICAGLAAAHDRGIVHRDIKPSNIMVDAAGRVRLLDFGVAIAGNDAHGGGMAGTPAYMAPEQRQGALPSKRSDVYSLGLVLYELFAGRPNARPLPPTSLPHVDVTMQAVIRWCLEEDPADRAPSAVEVAAILRAGDAPTAAANEGRLPIPEVILARGSHGVLRRRQAQLLTAAALIGTILVAGRMDAVLRLQHALPDPPSVLATRAEAVLAAAGLPASRARDREFWFEPDRARQRRGVARDRPVHFVYRRSASPLVAGNLFRVIRQTDPGSTLPGMAMVILDASGRLLHFEASDVEQRQPAPIGVADWSALFAAASLRPDDFVALDDPRPISAPHDRQAMWQSRHGGDDELRVTAASLVGYPTWFSIGSDVRLDADAMTVWSTHRGPLAEAFFWTLIAVVFAAVAIVAARTVKWQRGHLQAANRLTVFVLAGSVIAGLLRAHYVADVVEVTAFVLAMTGYSLIWAIFCGVGYLALEPFIRRRWPHSLVASTRLFAGRFRDAIVGRDVLVGALGGLVVVALVVVRFRISPDQHADMIIYPALESVHSWRRFGFVQALGLMDAVQFAVGGAFLVALSTATIRNTTIAVCAVVLLGTPLTVGGMPTSLADGVIAFAISGIAAIVFLQAGLLAVATTYSIVGLLVRVPIALDPAVWYFPMSAVTLATVAALVCYAGFVAQSGRQARPTHAM